MGLSRNKVAVSEGAAGSPPFYGERGETLESGFSEFLNRLNQEEIDEEEVLVLSA